MMKYLPIYLIATAVIVSCAAFKKDQVQRTQGLLKQSGFQTVQLEPQTLKDLPQHHLFESKTENQVVYQYADAEYCQCLLQGDQYAYQQYVKLIETLNAEAVPNTDPEKEAENMRAMPFFNRW